MQFTKAEAYGLHGMVFLAEQPEGKVVSLAKISEAQDVPEKFLAKIFQGLARAGLVKSLRGVKGGFLMAKPADSVTIKEVLEAIQGPYSIAKCLTGEEECDRAGSCPVLRLMQLTQERILEIFERHTIADLVAWEKSGSD